MDDFSAEMCTVGSGAAPASDPARFVLSHIAAERNVGLRSCRVRAVGGFEASPPRSTCIIYEIEIGGDASAEELTAIAHDADSAAPIPNLLREATEVRLDRVLVQHEQVR